MKKKLLSVLLTLAMVLALVPVTVLADGDTSPQETVGELTAGLTQQTDGEMADASDASKKVPLIKVSVTPTAQVPYSQADEKLGRTAGWWAGIRIKAPENINAGNVAQVKFRNSTNTADRNWESVIDGRDPYWMGAWNGIKESDLAKGETSFTITWYFNWDGDEKTGITVPEDSFTASNASAMEGVDQVIQFTFNLRDGVQLIAPNGTDVVWPGVQAVKVRGDGVEDGVEDVKYSEAYTKAGLTLGTQPVNGVYTLTIDSEKLDAVVKAGRDDETYKILENASNEGKLWFGMEYVAPSTLKDKVKSAQVKFDNGSYTVVELNNKDKDGFYNYIKVYDEKIGPVPEETATIQWLDKDNNLLTITKAVVKVSVKGTEPPAVTYTVTFNSNGGSAVEKQTIANGSSVTEPSAPSKEGYTFGGWYKDVECTEKWEFSAKVTEDITLYAKWTKDDPTTDPSDPGDEQDEYSIRVRSGIRHGDVSVSDRYAAPGTRVTITVDPETDYGVDWIEARRSSGGRVALTQSGRRYTFTMPASDVTIDVDFALQVVYTNYRPVEPVQPTAVTPVFSPVAWRPAASLPDVPAYSWSYPAAQWAYQNGYLDLAANGNFNLNGTVSHQQMWKIMAQWMGVPATDEQAVMSWARQNGAARGQTAAGAMTRQNVVTYLYECYFLMGGDVSVTGNLSAYADSRLITVDSTRNAWVWAVNKGIISGTTDGYLNPNRAVTRGEFAMILMRLCQNVMR